MVRPAVNSEKHILQITRTDVAALATANQNIALARPDVSSSDPTAVRQGCTIKAVYLELWLLGDGQQPSTTTVAFYKIENLGASPTFGEMQDLNAWNNKKNVLELHQGLIGDANTNPVPFFRGWIRIPKGKQRIGLGDAIKFTVSAITEGTSFCGLAIFKEYY